MKVLPVSTFPFEIWTNCKPPWMGSEEWKACLAKGSPKISIVPVLGVGLYDISMF
jgi:hypothetical protein